MSATIRILHYTTHDEECGIAKYQKQFIDGMEHLTGVDNVVFEYSPNITKNMSKAEFAVVLGEFKEQIKSFDILHIQHEISFYKHDELNQIVKEAIKQKKKVIITVHTSLEAGFPENRLGGIGPRSILHYLRAARRRRIFTSIHVLPMRVADLLIVHNSVAEKSLIKHGVEPTKIIKITHPVPKISFDLKTNEIHDNLGVKKDDVVYCTVGFLSKNKGMVEAVKALAFLPSNYKLAVIGGGHPSGDNDEFYDDLSDLIIKLNLASRVYITGYIKDDNELNALIRECDMCVHPYHRKYYSGVSSGSLNTSLANHKPAITYPAQSIIEMNQTMPAVALTDAFSYYELAKKIINLNLKKQTDISINYANEFAWPKEAIKFVDIYRQLADSN